MFSFVSSPKYITHHNQRSIFSSITFKSASQHQAQTGIRISTKSKKSFYSESPEAAASRKKEFIRNASQNWITAKSTTSASSEQISFSPPSLKAKDRKNVTLDDCILNLEDYKKIRIKGAYALRKEIKAVRRVEVGGTQYFNKQKAKRQKKTMRIKSKK